jgi:hypothetical protein
VDWVTAVKMVAEKSGIEVVETQSRRVDQDEREPLWRSTAWRRTTFAACSGKTTRS